MIKTSEISKIRSEMYNKLDAKRYEHTLGVAYTASSLAMRYEVDISKAILAGLLHDCAKCINDSKKIKICETNHIPITEAERKNPSLLHAKVGSFYAKTKYGIEDLEILNAISFHTTGRPDMTDLEKIIYIADYIEPGRKHLPNLNSIRKTVFIDIDLALLQILEDTLNYLTSNNSEIDVTTQKTYEFYKNLK